MVRPIAVTHLPSSSIGHSGRAPTERSVAQPVFSFTNGTQRPFRPLQVQNFGSYLRTTATHVAVSLKSWFGTTENGKEGKRKGRSSLCYPSPIQKLWLPSSSVAPSSSTNELRKLDFQFLGIIDRFVVMAEILVRLLFSPTLNHSPTSCHGRRIPT